MQERLQKIISRAGIASRRKAEEMITAGQVVVNGKVITELGSKADPNEDAIVIDGKKLDSRPPELVYIAMNKPRGCVTTTDDPEGRPTVMNLLGRLRERVYPVGRLDFHSEGLLLLTNDGDWANHILSAKASIPKKYVVKVNGMLPGSQLDKFRRGMHLDDGKTAPAKIRMAKAGPNPWYEVTLEEGRNRQIRRMFQALGFQVEKIKRIEIGPLKLGKMQTGEVRFLTPREVHFMLHPEDAPPETPRREKKPKQIGPKKDERPTVRRTASERIESGERIELRLHTEEEPPERPQKPGERRAGRPAVRKSAPREGGRSFDRGRPSAGGRRPSFGSRPSSGPRPSGNARPSFGGRPSGGGRPAGGERRSFGDRPSGGGRPSFGNRPPSGDRPTVGERRPFSGRPEGGDRPRVGERRPFSDRPASGGRPTVGERRPFGDRPSGDRRPPFSGDRRPGGGRPSFGDRPSGGSRPTVGPRSDGPRPTVGPKSSGGPRPADRGGRPSFGNRPPGGGFGGGRPQGPRDRDDDRGERPRSDRPENRGGPVRPPLRPTKRSGQPERDESGQFRSSSPRTGNAPGRGFGGGRPSSGRPSGGRPSGGRPFGGRPSGGRPSGGRPSGGRPSGRPGGRPGGPSRGPRGGR